MPANSKVQAVKAWELPWVRQWAPQAAAMASVPMRFFWGPTRPLHRKKITRGRETRLPWAPVLGIVSEPIMHTLLLSLALTAGVDPPRGGDRPIDRTYRPPQIDGSWTILSLEIGGRPALLSDDPTAVIENSIITFNQGGRTETIRLELARENRLIASTPSANDVTPTSPVRKSPHAEGDDRGVVTGDRDSSRSGSREADRKSSDEKAEQTEANRKRSPTTPPRGDPDKPDVGGTTGRTAPPRTVDRGTGEGSRANQVTERSMYNTGVYVLTGDYLAMTIKLPLKGTVEQSGERDRRDPSRGGSPSTVGDKRPPTNTTGPVDVGPDVKV